MTTKDRLAALHAAQSYDNDDVEEEEYVIVRVEELNECMEEVFNQVTVIREMIKTFESNVKEVQMKHTAILSSPQSDTKTKEELEDLMAVIKKNTEQIRDKLAGIDQKKHACESSAHLRIRKIQHSSLSRKFIDILTEYNRTQNDYKTHMKSRIQRQLEIAGRSVTDDELDDMFEEGNTIVIIPDIFIKTQQAKQILSDVELRHAELIKLEKSITNLRDLFVEMLILVESQSDMIDRIENHVENVRDCVEKATRDLKKAHDY